MEPIVSLQNRWGRIYGGGGYLYNRKPALKRGVVQWGLELRGALIGSPLLGNLMEGLFVAPVFGADIKSVEELDWKINMKFLSGLEWSHQSRNRWLRRLLGVLSWPQSLWAIL